jgi:hypothetical protein
MAATGNTILSTAAERPTETAQLPKDMAGTMQAPVKPEISAVAHEAVARAPAT